MRALSLAFLALFFGFAVLPFAVQALKLVPPGKLDGVTLDVPRVELDWSSYREGKFQESFEANFGAGLGLRTQAVRADNELNFRLFHALGHSPRHFAVLGKDGYLFERGYVDSFNRRDEVPIEEIEARVKSLLSLQQFMEARGKTLLVLITPNKAMLYSEYLPDSLIDSDRQRVTSSYEKLLSLLQRYGVHYFDAEGYLSSLKSTVPFTFFTNSGTHWGDPAACEVSARVLERIGEQLRRRVPRLQCAPYVETPALRLEDTDVLRICNLWSPERLMRPAFYSKARIMGSGPASVLIVGGSFNRALIRYLNRARIDNTLFYYYSKLERRGRSMPIDKAALDFERQVFQKDVIIVEVNVEVIASLGFGFIEDAARAMQNANK